MRSRLALLFLLLPALACNALFPPRPAVEWDADPMHLILSANTSGGMLYDPNFIPDARLWGDGRLLWVEYDGNGGRRVLEAYLADADITAQLQAFVEAGFFGWEDYYSEGIVYDAPSSCLFIALKSESKSVCETLSGAPPKFETLYRDLASGAGQTGTDYTPTAGFLTASPTGPTGSTVIADWPADALGLSLRDLPHSTALEGEALTTAWAMVNQHPLHTIVREDGQEYLLILLIPDVTQMQPPTEP